MRTPWRRSLAGSVPALPLLLLGFGAAACSVPAEGDGALGQELAALNMATATGVTGGVGGASVAATSVAFASVAVSSSHSVGAGGGFGGGMGDSGSVVGFWQFDDCTAQSAALVDSSGFGNTANRTASVACVPGIEGLAVDFNQGKDVVSAADGASFTFTDHIGVAAWINPTTVAGTHTIVEQQFAGKTTFALAVKKGSVEFSVTLSNGKAVKSSAPISANVWSHVAGNYDGQFVFLYLNGQQVGQVDVPGAIREANGPIEIGNNASKQPFNGAIDNVWISTGPVSVNDIAALACIQRPPTFVATPASGPAVQADTPVDYSVVLTDNDVGFCQAGEFFFEPGFVDGFNTTSTGNTFVSIAPGASATFQFTATADDSVDPGVTQIPFFIFEEFPNFNSLQGQVDFNLVAPTGCFVATNRELMIRDLSVVEDPVRTTFTGDASDPRTGAWTFGNLMRNLAPTPDQAPAMVLKLFQTWLTDQQVGGFTVPARPSIQQLVIDPWPKNPDGSLDLTRSPLRLSAIVNRLDVRKLNQGKAGEGRFVFSLLDPNDPTGTTPFEPGFTLIVEYNLPATTDADVLSWANRWHALSTHPFPSEEYNAALQTLTTQFMGRDVAPGQPNGSSLAQLRTNEIALSFEWELREFHLSPTSGFLEEASDALTPDLSLNGSPLLADFVNQNESAILNQLHTVPPTFEGQPFQAGSSINPLTFWSAPGIVNNDARELFSLNTCNGCHGPETGTAFLQIAPRFPGQMSQLSGFLTGTTVFDPITGVPRTFGDLAARKADLTQLVCTSPAPGTPAAAAKTALIRQGRRQVH